MGRLFISYRRDDTQDITDHLYEKLAARFGKANIFMDVDSIPPGADFRKILREAVAGCDVALVMIGRQWLTLRDASGARRLDSLSDFVRIEVEAALAREIPVVPVLAQGVAMVRESDLPPSMSELAYRNAEEVRSGQHFNADAERLIGRLAPVLNPPARPASALQLTHQPAPVAPPPTPRYPSPSVPARLVSLGFRGVNPNGTPAIVPPLITIPADPFLMGSDKSKDSQAFDDELPQHSVDIAAFQLAKYPVTVAEYALGVRARAVREPPNSGDATWANQQMHPDHPAVCVSWQDANSYISWLREAIGERGWRLPSEAEWEKAARWDESRHVSRLYPWGIAFDQNRCNTGESGIRNNVSCGHLSGHQPAPLWC